MNARHFIYCYFVAILIGGNMSLGFAVEAQEKRKVGDNILRNHAFEEVHGSKPVGWREVTWGGKAEFKLTRAGKEGSSCVSIHSTTGADAGWQASVPVKTYSRYRLSGWIRTAEIKGSSARGALFNLHNIQPLATTAVKGTEDWTRVELVFETGHNDVVQVNCLFGGWGLATGTAWFDDLELELLEQRKWDPKISIDAKKEGQPISKYIYGQFIEHLGRCIYGGIWAEMLEDRKFYHVPGTRESPWKNLGGTDALVMEKVASFVGEHTPRILLPGKGKKAGLSQEGLGIIRDREYLGRIWLAGEPSAVPVSVSLIWGEGPGDRQTVQIRELSSTYVKTPLRFVAGASTDDARLEITSPGSGSLGSLLIGTVSLMPADNVHGMRRDTLALLRELDAPIYRWPGGNFVSGYDWKDGIGDPDRRPPRKNPAWRGVEHNDFGIDEFMTFCRILGTEPYIAVNSGLGGIENAIKELEYVNGHPARPMGKRRAENGHPEPYKVKWWGIGNEMYGGWQLGHMPLKDYIKKHNLFAEAMRTADSSIKLVAVGAVGNWSEGMMQECANHMDLISEHFYRQGLPGLTGHVGQIPMAIRRIAQAHRDYRLRFDALRGKDIRIALDEWNYWYGPHVYGELGTRYFLKDALGVAAGLNEYARQSDIFFMANYAQTVNVIGCIKTNKTHAAFATTGLVLKLYRKHFGTIPVHVESSPPLDVAAAWTPDHSALVIAVVNPTMNALEIPLELSGLNLSDNGRRWQIAGNDPMAYNEPRKKLRVSILETPIKNLGKKLTVVPCSITLFRLEKS